MGNEFRHGTRIDWADGAKAVSILLVAFHHAQILAASRELSLPAYAYLDALLKPIRMPLFFTISGMFAERVLNTPWRSVIRKRLVPYYYLYAVWLLLSWLFYRYVQAELRHPEAGQSIRQLMATVFIPQGGLWFLWVLVVYFAAGRLLHSFRHSTVLIILALVAVLTDFDIFRLHYPLNNVLLYAPFFFFGVWHNRAVAIVVCKYPWVILFGGFVAYVAATMLMRRTPYPLVGLTLIQSILGLCLALGATALTCRSKQIRSFFSYLGRNTLPIYVAHAMVINLLVATVSSHGLDQAFWIVPGVAMVSVAASLTLRNLFGRVADQWLYTADGVTAAWDAIVVRQQMQRSRPS